MKTVFVCSTIWDLVDVRSEVRDFLQRNGFQPLMSEHEDFPVDLSQTGTYEKCLEAVRACDVFVLILNNRYGGSRKLKQGEISIAHQEFRAAVETRRPFAGFIRDRLDADWATWKQTGELDSLSFVDKDKDLHLFDVLQELNQSASDGTALWRETFKDSVEIKSKLSWKLGINDYSNNYLAQAQMLHALPRLILEARGGSGKGNDAAEIGLYVANIGSGAAEQVEFNLATGSLSGRSRSVQDVLPNNSINWKQDVPMPSPETMIATLRYQNVLGSVFESEFMLKKRTDGIVPSITKTYFGPPR